MSSERSSKRSPKKGREENLVRRGDPSLFKPESHVAALQRHVLQARGWRRRAIATVAGGLSVLSMAPFFFWPILFLTLPTFVWLIDSTNSFQIEGDDRTNQWPIKEEITSAANVGWWFGFGYFLCGLFWIGEAFLVEAHIFGWLMPFAVIAMPAGLALFFAAAAALARLFWPAGAERVMVLAIALGATEWLRGNILTGFPWNTLGYALTSPLSLMQTVSLIGVYGLTFWVVIICAIPPVCVFNSRAAQKKSAPSFRTKIIYIILFSILPLVAMYAYGTQVLAAGPPPNLPNVKLRIVQPSTPQKDKWRGDKQEEIFYDHINLSKQNAEGSFDNAHGITHVFWPEAAMPFLPLSAPRALEKIGEMLPNSTILIAGALRVDRSGEPAIIDYDSKSGRRVYNSLMAFDSEGKLFVVYDKIHLVPFGEYLPFQQAFEAIGLRQLTRLRGGFTVGNSPRQILNIAGLPPVVALICYEVIFPGEVIQTEKRPSLLINLTNDGWFGHTTGPHQHFHQTRVRAVEEGLPIIRSANNGISAVVGPFGRIMQRLDLDERGTIDSALPFPAKATLYSKYENVVLLLNLLFLVVLLSTQKFLHKN